MDDVAIRVENVSKVFKLPHEKSSSIKSAIVNFYKRDKGYEMQHALQDVSLEVKRGEFFGIVGRNGSGKSTLLKMLAGIYTPTKGNIQVNGSLTPFIELGVGFNPELTARENVFLNGALLGFSRKETQAMYKDIVEFAELERFMDQKLKNYSSGMQVRLAFSIAIQAQSEILVLDEVLAVGDIKFQEKCYEYFEEIKNNKTVVFVSHDMKSITKYCDRVAILEKSKLLDIGDPEEMVAKYGAVMSNESLKVRKDSASQKGVHIGTGEASISKIELLDQGGSKTDTIKAGEEFKLRLHYECKKEIKKPSILISLFNGSGQKLFSTNTDADRVQINSLSGKGHIDFYLKENPFAPGRYKINTGVFDERMSHAYDHFRDAFEFSVSGERVADSPLVLAGEWRISGAKPRR